mgnify:CR=1 FL=1
MSNTINALKSIYDIELNAADGTPNFLEQFKGKAGLLVNTTVGCGNANQLEVLQWLQNEFGGEDFQIIAIPTNDFCGPGVTKGKWSQGITCGMDSENYGKDVYGTTFKYSEMVSSIPNDLVASTLGVEPGHNGLGHPNGEPHDLYKTISKHMHAVRSKNNELNIERPTDKYYSWWLNCGFDGGQEMGGNYEKYLIDKDGYVIKHYQCTVLNYDIEKTLKQDLIDSDLPFSMGIGRSRKIFEEEYQVISNDIREAINNTKSVINPAYEVGA